MEPYNALTDSQIRLVEQHLHLVGKTICHKLYASPNDIDMDRDELQQVGNLALCMAAIHYDNERPFTPYAKTVIRNALYDHCRKARQKKEMFCSLDRTAAVDMPNDDGSRTSYLDLVPSHEPDLQKEKELFDYLKELEDKASGIHRKGIHAMRLNLAGYNSVEISKIFGVKPNLVRAWMSKAAKKLRKNETLYQLLN